jgi:hypothetical protein
MKKYLLALAALATGMTLAMPPMAQAASAETTTAGKTVKKIHHAKKAAAKKPVLSKEDADDPEPDVSGSVAVDYTCELGNKLTIHANLADRDHIALRWHNRLIRLDRVATTTGANRFESRKRGLVWIGIPAKGILLDSKKGQQLANECKSASQMAMATAPTPASTALIAPDPAAATVPVSAKK